ncbi:LLM class flavin-dependent oxidoreductase [Pseudosporangium ferrugineum]|uniref:Alkanesulfonate monooxygenase SsuD/methylene tetrahydromethanopterin reductase-like flavin-dependent oxidoreductase (Luciferase family) n=1 Tax=Pseudosporangium ferrugineum TaxID=439699 RepID=A0A2T0SHU1_9ACTN|nr:LLM class flavin-dependent oxidoreductase [Pseudosporangium ferrugineum]PRY32984.1 alkanesulfonate monooxygenase SsuD/methylene tetrahydromethanopterin reductase-like flavin-dependent oxidoreductase (luciferase family) [Pseudosporangium ferrugineum]
MTRPAPHLAVALDGLGWHPAAWRTSPVDAAAVFTPGYWTGLVAEAEAGLLDLVTFEDTFGPPTAAPGEINGRLDAVLVASRVAPSTRHIGLVPVATTTHTEPFHLSTALATLDYLSGGRAGWQARVSARPEEAALLGRRPAPDLGAGLRDLFDEAADAVEVVRRLWDSWADDAVIKDAATGRFIDRDRLHYIDFAGRWFSVKGPSIVPRPPQGQPVVAALAHSAVPYAFAAGSADVVFVTPTDAAAAGELAARLRTANPALKVFADLVVFLDEHGRDAVARRARLDELYGAPWRSDALIFAGSPEELAGLLAAWHAAGIDGFRLRPGALPYDLEAITRLLVPVLRDRGVFRTGPPSGTLRERLGLPPAVNRYEAAEGARVA